MAIPSFKDHFSAHAPDYARYRPRYPEALFTYLASLGSAFGVAWDCGTGNGQAARSLAGHFECVVATDASADQVANAVAHPRVAYHVAPASRSPLASQAADLVTVAQALHWFDLDGFYAEVHRVLKPGGALAVWAYTLHRITPAVDAVVHRYYEDVVGLFWPLERGLVEDGYRTLAFPFEEVQTPAFDMALTWSLDDLLGYLGTWSATRRFMKTHGVNPVEQVEEELAQAWGPAADAKRIHWPLHLRVGYHDRKKGS